MLNAIVMVGISGSGKSSVAKKLSTKYNAIIISSDELRKELFNDVNDMEHNGKVFETLNQRVKENLLNGNNVIVDATNITMKSRKSVLNTINDVKKTHEICVTAYILTKPLSICIEDDEKRVKKVGKDVIIRQAERFEIPFYEEGFDEIKIGKIENKKVTEQDVFEDLIYGMEGYDQKTKFHKYDLLEHTMRCYKEVEKRVGNKYPSLIAASLLHDIGKLSAQKIDEKGQASYLCHANIGTYELLDSIRLSSDTKDTVETLFYVNYHMLPFNWVNEKTHEKYKQIFGKEKYDNLMILHECDKIACGVK